VFNAWYVAALIIASFAVLYPEDAANLLQLVALAPRLLKLWLSQRLMMARLWPRLALDGFLMRRRMSRLNRRHNNNETTNTKDN